MAGALLQIGLITVALVGAVGLMGLAVGLFTGSVRLPHPTRRRAVPATDRRPVQQVAADLRRLARQLALVPTGAPQARRRGLQAAYDDVLVEAALLLDVPHALATTPPGRARDVERLRLETALRTAGLAVGD
ncbi:hypothetical protein [Blastococcus sp. SYSU D00820]